MDDLSKWLLDLATSPHATMEDLLAGMEALTQRLEQENRILRRREHAADCARAAAASPEELRKLAQKNLAKKYK